MDGDGLPGPADYTHPLRRLVVKPRAHSRVVIDDLIVKN